MIVFFVEWLGLMDRATHEDKDVSESNFYFGD
ncbi:unannotated protein [freshwater metagenome]|uniref:Unannotated protein n=1 Tax=freshwater metagenome TaxID=449393 RepID=A0A6J6G2X9_9ZZZZ